MARPNFMLDLIPAQQPIKNQHQILWCGYQHVITSRPITTLVFMRRPAFFCLGVNALVRRKCDGKNVRLWCEQALMCHWGFYLLLSSPRPYSAVSSYFAFSQIRILNLPNHILVLPRKIIVWKVHVFVLHRTTESGRGLIS